MSVIGADIGVVEGLDGWLFLERYDDVRPLAAAADLGAWRAQTLPALRLQFRSRAERCAARGVAFVALVAPEKASVYPDQLPAGFAREEPGAAEALASACRRDGVKFLDLVAALRRARGPMDVYNRTDSHWTMFGAWVAYNAVMDTLEEVAPGRRVAPSRVRFSHKRAFGDLGVHLRPERRGWTQTVDIAGPEPAHVTETWDERESVYQEFTCEGGAGVALVIRDSFSTFLAPFLTRTFAKTVFAAAPIRLLDDMVEDLKPDVVLFEVAERALFYTPDPLADWSTGSWRQMFLESWDEAPGFRANRLTRIALRAGQSEEACARAEEAAAVDADHRFSHNFAAALIGARRFERARDLCAAALALHPGSRVLHYHHAVALRGMGEASPAVAALDRALKLHPSNGRYLALLGEWLAEDGRPGQAISLLRRALGSAPADYASAELLQRLQAEGSSFSRSQPARAQTTLMER